MGGLLETCWGGGGGSGCDGEPTVSLTHFSSRISLSSPLSSSVSATRWQEARRWELSSGTAKEAETSPPQRGSEQGEEAPADPLHSPSTQQEGLFRPSVPPLHPLQTHPGPPAARLPSYLALKGER